MTTNDAAIILATLALLFGVGGLTWIVLSWRRHNKEMRFYEDHIKRIKQNRRDNGRTDN